MKKTTEKFTSESFTDFNILSILLSRPVRLIAASGIMMLIAYFIGK